MNNLARTGLTTLLLLISSFAFSQTFDSDRESNSDDFLDSVPFTDESDEPFASSFPVYYCLPCRDPFDYPMDFVAFYYNGHELLGQGPYRDSTYYLTKITYGDASQFVLVWTSFLSDIEGSMIFPTQLIEIKLRRPDGHISKWNTLLNQPNLPIGWPEAEVDSEESYDDEHEDDREDFRFWYEYWADWEESHDFATRELDCYADFSDPMNTIIICKR